MNLKKLTALLTACVFTTSSNAITMQEVFDSVNAQGNTNGPAILRGQTMNLYTGGSLFMRMPKRTYNLASITPPSFNAGCGGIDLFMGGFSYINKEQFVAMLRNIGSNALGYGFKLAIQNLCPTCDNVMQALQATANAMNKQNIDSCEAAKGFVNASAPDTWQRGRQNAAKNFGVNSNIFSDITDAWSNVMGNEGSANNTINTVANNNPDLADQLPKGNIVWKALRKMNGIDDEYRMVLMSMIGTTIFPTDSPSARPIVLTPKDISVQQLVGKQDTSPDLDFPIYRCAPADLDCLNPTEGKANDVKSVKSFRYMVRTKMQAIADKIATRSSHDSVTDATNFLNVTDLPIYKMIAVATSLNNSAIADTLIGRYQDLIAAKYAEVYIRTAVTDLNAALAAYASSVSDPSVSEEIKKLQPKLDSLRETARQILADSYSQTVSTFNIAQEVQHMERSLSANLSQTLRSSLAFGKGLK